MMYNMSPFSRFTVNSNRLMEVSQRLLRKWQQMIILLFAYCIYKHIICTSKSEYMSVCWYRLLFLRMHTAFCWNAFPACWTEVIRKVRLPWVIVFFICIFMKCEIETELEFKKLTSCTKPCLKSIWEAMLWKLWADFGSLYWFNYSSSKKLKHHFRELLLKLF